MRYSNTGKEKENGVVYTPADMANYLAEEIISFSTGSFGDTITILDPAAGGGELLISMIKSLRQHYKEIGIKVVGYETDETACIQTQNRLQKIFCDVTVEIINGDFLASVDSNNVDKFDFVIANPPYVRTQIMGSERAQQIADKLSLAGRVDIYYAFLLYTKSVLKDSGVAGYITSNKFLTIKAGSSVRNYMINNYKIHRITDLGDTKLFSASVLPCIIVFSNGQTTNGKSVKFTSVYEETSNVEATTINGIFESIYKCGYFKLKDGKVYRYQQGSLQSINVDSLWTISSQENEKWLVTAERKIWKKFSDIGKIRVGIKTTADNVFIGDKWTGETADLELLRPLITHRNAGQITANNQSHGQVLYTHTIKAGKKVAYNIDEYPKSKAYLLKHYAQLSGRNYIQKANRNWYEIWVPQNPASWVHRKIVFRDISKKPQFWLDETGAIVNGDCYWIDILPNVSEDTVYLALAVANSQFIERYYDVKFNTKLYSGKRRFMTQYVEQFPIPHNDTPLAQATISLVKEILAEGNAGSTTSGLKQELDILVERMFS